MIILLIVKPKKSSKPLDTQEKFTTKIGTTQPRPEVDPGPDVVNPNGMGDGTPIGIGGPS